MARLNEVPAPAPETLEAIKRKFTRQNREIARVNSTQSIRIRNLETEISRLLAENISIREDAIYAKAELERWKGASKLRKEVQRMRDALEQKLSEVNVLVGDLASLPEKAARRSSHKRRRDGFVSELAKTDEEKEPRHRQTLLEQEGRLPAILEDKCFPRRTLEASEIRALKDEAADDATESPDLGPPPVAHFEEHEVVTFNTARSPRRTSTELIEESERPTRSSATIGESRRKRRTSTLLQSCDLDWPGLQDPDAPMILEEPQKKDVAAQPQSILKKGAKRKLEVSELEDTSRVSKELDDFIFQRKSAAPPTTVRPSRFSRPLGRQNQEDTQLDESRLPEQPARRVLAPKSTNSPAKRHLGALPEKVDREKDEKDDAKPERRVVSRVRTKPNTLDIPPSVVSESPVDAKVRSEVEEHGQRHPKTPAFEADDMLSPISTAPSTKQRTSKEMAITNSVEDVLNGSIGRNSRRARAAVSYAEPNLRDKMRRPGKGLVGAVEGLAKSANGGDEDRARSASTEVGSESLRQARNIDAAVGMKQDPDLAEEEDLIKWGNLKRAGKSEPASPLKDKVAPASRRSEHGEDELSKAVSRLSVFDPPTSSPAPAVDHDEVRATTNKSQTDGQTIRLRRNSVQASSKQEAQNPSSSSLSTQSTRRPNSALGVRQSDTSQDDPRSHIKRSASVATLSGTRQPSRGLSTGTKPTTTADAVAPGVDDTTAYQHRGSVLSRRRSMMV